MEKKEHDAAPNFRTIFGTIIDAIIVAERPSGGLNIFSLYFIFNLL